jgi:NTP pyrophosphatase (non-canonical NTP hydrolase)
VSYTSTILELREEVQLLKKQLNRSISLEQLRAANQVRARVWPGAKTKADLSFRGVELAGETGEACNVIKKLERERHGWAGSRDTKEHLAEELADIIICCDLVAMATDIDLAEAVRNKFNATSEALGIKVML